MKVRGIYIELTLTALICMLTACTSPDNSDLNSGDSRVIWQNIKVAGITTSNFVLTLSATLLPPSLNGNTLTADDVHLSGTSALVSYNLPGAIHMGAVDLISLANAALPVRYTTLTFSNQTVNGITNYNNNIFSVGASNDTVSYSWPAVMSSISLSAGSILTGGSLATNGTMSVNTTQQLLNTYAGTGITSWNGKLYAISGGGGASASQGLQVMDPSSLAVAANLTTVLDPRGLNYYYGGGTDLWIVTGGTSYGTGASGGAQLFDVNSSNQIVNQIPIGGGMTTESKSTVQVGKTMVLASKGEAGLTIICQADGKTLASVAAPTGVSGFTNAQTVTNAAVAGPGLLFVANGEAGVYVYTMIASTATTSSCKNVTLNPIGVINLGDATYSANNVIYSSGSLFIATGLGGFKVVTVSALSPLLGANLDFM